MRPSFAVADAIAECVLRRFESLPSKCKPRLPKPGNGLSQREWAPIAGIVAEERIRDRSRLECMVVASGMKCTPQSKLETASGIVLHDCHAETLAIRAFNRLLLEQCSQMGSNGHDSGGLQLIERRPGEKQNESQGQPFQIRQAIRLHMYCSECPCGDASMELVMARQEDATPWTTPTDITSEQCEELLGRGHFDRLGIVRRKPARPDAPVSLSKSCSDKLALKQSMSLLSGITSFFVSPLNAYLATLVLPAPQMNVDATQRAFGAGGRMRSLCAWPGVDDYTFRPFIVQATNKAFAFSRDEAGSTSRPSNIASIEFNGTTEVLINGTLQGRKVPDVRAASSISRRSMWVLGQQLAQTLGQQSVIDAMGGCDYRSLKESKHLDRRRKAKQEVVDLCLSPWAFNPVDKQWQLASRDT